MKKANKPVPTPRSVGRDFAKGYSTVVLVAKYETTAWIIESKLRKHVQTLRKVERRQRD